MNETQQHSRGRQASRRTFLKTSAAATGAAALAFGTGKPIIHALAADYAAGQVPDREEKIFQAPCYNNCFGHCRLNVHVRDGKVVKTSRAPLPDPRYAALDDDPTVDDSYYRICLRGLSHPQRIYSPTRLKYPMKRAGARGENKWQRISWEEAINTTAEKFTAVQRQYGKTALGIHHGSGNFGTLNGSMPGSLGLLEKTLGATNIDLALDAGYIPGINRVCGFYPGAWNTNEIADIVNSRNIYVWGHNMTVSAIHQWHFVADAMENGAKLTVFDPNFTGIAAKAHRHVSMRPGTDTALIMSMIQVILAEKIYDQDFLLAHTCAPFLVRESDGMYLRMSDMGVPAKEGPIFIYTGKHTVIDPNLVWDTEKNKAVPVDEATAPALEGSFEVRGVKVRTAFDLLRDQVASFDPETSKSITDVAPDVVRAVARDFAKIKPSASLIGMGNQAYDNGPVWGHAIATLHAVTGQIGKSGHALGNPWFMYLGINFGMAAPEAIACIELPELLETGKVKGKVRPPIKALLISQGNPITAWVDQNYWVKTYWPTLDFVVVVDDQMTDTAQMADIVLPKSHWFEHEDILPLGGTHPFIQHGDKAIEPLYESRPDVDIHRLLATKMGFGESYAGSNEDILKQCFETPLTAGYGLTVENVRKYGTLRFQNKGYIAWNDLKFNTQSGRMEFYCDKPVDQAGAPVAPERTKGQRLPTWEQPREASVDNPLFKKYPLVLNSERPRFRVHTQWFNTEWLRELDPEPIIRLNPGDAAKRNIAHGDYVEIYNDRGHAVAKAVLSGGVRPGVMVYPKGWQRYQHKAGSFSELDSRAFDSVGINQSFFDVLAEVRKWNGQV